MFPFSIKYSKPLQQKIIDYDKDSKGKYHTAPLPAHIDPGLFDGKIKVNE